MLNHFYHVEIICRQQISYFGLKVKGLKLVYDNPPSQSVAILDISCVISFSEDIQSDMKQVYSTV